MIQVKAKKGAAPVEEKKPLVIYNPEERALGKFKYKSNLPELNIKRSVVT
jgi:hypothetical protein